MGYPTVLPHPQAECNVSYTLEAFGDETSKESCMRSRELDQIKPKCQGRVRKCEVTALFRDRFNFYKPSGAPLTNRDNLRSSEICKSHSDGLVSRKVRAGIWESGSPCLLTYSILTVCDLSKQ